MEHIIVIFSLLIISMMLYEQAQAGHTHRLTVAGESDLSTLSFVNIDGFGIERYVYIAT